MLRTELWGQMGFLHTATPTEHLVSKTSRAAQVPHSWGISVCLSAHAVKCSDSRKRADRGSGVHKFGWDIHSGDKNEPGQLPSPL